MLMTPERAPGRAMAPGGMRETAGWLITRPEVTCVQFAGDGLLTMPAPALRAYLGPLLQLESIRVDTTALGTGRGGS